MKRAGTRKHLFFFTWPGADYQSAPDLSCVLSSDGEREAAVDLVLVQTFFLLLWNLCYK